MAKRGFSVVELIGILAILAIVVCLVLPRVTFSGRSVQAPAAVNQARLTQAAVLIQGLQSVVTEHLARFGSLASQNGVPLEFSDTYEDFGGVLLREGLLERPFALGFGSSSVVQLRKVSPLAAESAAGALNGAYDLDGDGRNDIKGGVVVEVVVRGVAIPEAEALNSQLDGTNYRPPTGQEDLRGRVVYGRPNAAGQVEVHIYVMQK